MVAGVLVAFVYVFLMAKSFSISRWKAIAALIIICIPSFLVMLLIGWISTGFKTWSSFQSIRLFLVVYLLVFPVSKLFDINAMVLSDLYSPCLCLLIGVSHFGCMFTGCCRGYRWEYGIWNRKIGCNVFPIQIIEAFVALSIVVILIIVKDKKILRKGYLYPLMMIIYGLTRFCIEFAKDNQKVVLKISGLAIHAFFIFIFGLAVFLSLKSQNTSYKIKDSKEKKNV